MKGRCKQTVLVIATVGAALAGGLIGCGETVGHTRAAVRNSPTLHQPGHGAMHGIGLASGDPIAMSVYRSGGFAALERDRKVASAGKGSSADQDGR